jgi:hypothetical protein
MSLLRLSIEAEQRISLEVIHGHTPNEWPEVQPNRVTSTSGFHNFAQLGLFRRAEITTSRERRVRYGDPCRRAQHGSGRLGVEEKNG